ncbi:hypothetical protein [Macrococcoides bohemicum]|uniref:hypothetical protein n=1 Tax=Macrococcoides bohemicum TaxID=1903056 RepID=UPI00165D9E4C|nr:hypothetical protein [Macrococcus bohemicus]MBC9873538.1 hypothetical protein [Macrococcus bohemicus]
MKKLLISALSFSVLLVGCGQEKQDNKEVNKIDKNEEKVKYISDEKLKKDVQNFIDGVTMNFESFKTIEGGGMSDDIPGNMEASANQMLSNKQEIENYIKENNLKPKDKINLQYISEGIGILSDMINNMTDDMTKVIAGDMSEEDFQKETDDFTKKENVIKAGDNFEEAIKYYENKGINSNDLKEIFDDNSQEETSNNDTTSDDPDGDGYSSDLVDTFKVNKSGKVGPTTFTITKVETATEPVTEDNSYDFEGYKVGDEAQMIIVYMKLKNNTDENADYYPAQDEIVTDTGEQVAPALFDLDIGLVTEMKGAVESEGRVVYLLKNSNVKEIKNITFIAGAYIDPETMDEITPEQKIEIPLEK